MLINQTKPFIILAVLRRIV